MDDIATIRDAIVRLRSSDNIFDQSVSTDALDAITRLEAEITRLRANELDMRVVPEGWWLETIEWLQPDVVLVGLRAIHIRDDRGVLKIVRATGPTPRDALLAAVGRIGG